jgi:hypothetical protein
MEETSYFTGAVTTPTQLPGLTVCGAPAPEPAPAVVTKEYEWSLGGITEDTYVTLTYTNPDGTTGGLSDYYGALGSQYIFCARHTATASHGIITLMGECPALHLHQHQHQHLSLSLSHTNYSRSTDNCYFSTYSSRWYYKHYRRRT